MNPTPKEKHFEEVVEGGFDWIYFIFFLVALGQTFCGFYSLSYYELPMFPKIIMIIYTIISMGVSVILARLTFDDYKPRRIYWREIK